LSRVYTCIFTRPALLTHAYQRSPSFVHARLKKRLIDCSCIAKVLLVVDHQNSIASSRHLAQTSNDVIETYPPISQSPSGYVLYINTSVWNKGTTTRPRSRTDVSCTKSASLQLLLRKRSKTSQCSSHHTDDLIPVLLFAETHDGSQHFAQRGCTDPASWDTNGVSLPFPLMSCWSVPHYRTIRQMELNSTMK
jgi:hypothetical protein